MDILINTSRAMLAVLTICILPGYTLIHFLFARSQLDILERFYLTVLSSLGITSLIAFVLSRSKSGLTAQTLVLALLLFAAFWLLCAWVRSLIQGQKSVPSEPVLDQPSQSIWLLLGMSLFVLLSGVIGLSTTSRSLGLTEFYMTPQQLSAEGVEYSVVDDFLVVPISITNREGQQVTYRVESWRDEKQVSTQSGIAVNDGETWSGNVLIPRQTLGNAQFVEIKLFWPQKLNPVAQLRLWLSPDAFEKEKENEP